MSGTLPYLRFFVWLNALMHTQIRILNSRESGERPPTVEISQLWRIRIYAHACLLKKYMYW
jgi:hypothetical protein